MLECLQLRIQHKITREDQATEAVQKDPLSAAAADLVNEVVGDPVSAVVGAETVVVLLLVLLVEVEELVVVVVEADKTPAQAHGESQVNPRPGYDH